MYTLLYVFGNQGSTKTALGRFLSNLNVSLDAVFRSHPAASASHSDSEKWPEGWMEEVLHAIERGFSLAASLWAECACACLGLSAPMSMSVCTYPLMYMSRRKHPHTTVCSHCLQLLVGVCNTHGEKKGREQRGTQVNYK